MTDVIDGDTKLKSSDASATHFRKDRRRKSRPRFEMSVLVSFPGDRPNRKCKLVQVSGMRGYLIASTNVEIGQKLLLTNPKSLTQVACRVGYVKKHYRAFHVGLEFTADPSDFWDFTMPPSDSDPNQQNFGASGSSSVSANATPRSIKRWRILKLTALALAGFTSVYFLFAARPHESTTASATTLRSIFQDIAPEQARLIPDVENYRLATTNDFNREASAWLANSGQQLGGEFQCAFSPRGQSRVYVLIGKGNIWRIVILSGGELRYDAQYRAVAIVARVSKQAVQKITWADPLHAAPEGDGLLFVRTANDIGSGVVLFSRGGQIVSGSPSDYRQIPIT
jgi:hypothetical protein